MYRSLWLALSCALALGALACNNWCLGDCECSDPCCGYGYGCYEDPACPYGEPCEYSGWCESDADCAMGQVCHPNSYCVEVVEGCPLTDECLGDPEGYTPEWQGIDPLFVGSFSGDGVQGRVEVMLDFYEDHVYGEAQGLARLDRNGYDEWFQVTVTGIRDRDQLQGQIVDATGYERVYDATFEARLLSASEISGSATVSSDEGSLEVSFHLFRTSPCGCEPDCRFDADCPDGQACEEGRCVDEPQVGCQHSSDCQAGQVCLDGQCVTICYEDADCPAGHSCQQHACVPGCAYACCSDADCPEGYACQDHECACEFACCSDADCPEGDLCADHACRTPCAHRCDCEAGEVCEDGFCAVPDEPPPTDCETDCDCDYAAGERCEDGHCTLPPTDCETDC
ncbi:MAG: hypothetical protein JXR96_27150, partial [Deltaproteobacteria bacterium]|nr:hypothetical protein [Deltaproteobacteria bacterium]